MKINIEKNGGCCAHKLVQKISPISANDINEVDALMCDNNK